jgi:AcrR family transcriptional regulator
MSNLSAFAIEEPISFRDWVEIRQNNATDRRKGERTRDRIRLATIELLNEVSYSDLKVSAICDRAGITPPVLYLYFDSKETLVHSVLLEFLQEYTGRMAARDGARTPFQAMFESNLLWIRSARANSGLMRCLLRFSEEQADFALLFSQESNRWHERITQSIIRRFPNAESERDEVHFVVHALGGMMDEITRRLFDAAEPELSTLVETIARTDEDLAKRLTLIWHRAIYGADPALTESDPFLPRLSAAARKAARIRATKTSSQ